MENLIETGSQNDVILIANTILANSVTNEKSIPFF